MKKKRKIIKYDKLNLKELENMGQLTLFDLAGYLKNGGAAADKAIEGGNYGDNIRQPV